MLSGWFVRPDGSKRPLRHRFMERRFTGVITSTPVASPGLLPYSLIPLLSPEEILVQFLQWVNFRDRDADIVLDH